MILFLSYHHYTGRNELTRFGVPSNGVFGNLINLKEVLMADRNPFTTPILWEDYLRIAWMFLIMDPVCKAFLLNREIIELMPLLNKLVVALLSLPVRSVAYYSAWNLHRETINSRVDVTRVQFYARLSDLTEVSRAETEVWLRLSQTFYQWTIDKGYLEE
jgi:hypothetical protein